MEKRSKLSTKIAMYSMKYLIAIALAVLVASPAFASHVATEDRVACGKQVLTGELVPHCDSGGIMPTTAWVVYQARTFINGASTESEKALKIVNSEAEFLRLSQLEVARKWIEMGWQNKWRGTIVGDWITRYLAGER